MADVKWIKLSTDIFDNRKIKLIESMPDGDALVVIWLKLLILAGVINEGGCIYFTKDIPYTEELLSTQFNRPINTIRLALQTFQQFEMIEIVNDLIMVSNWEKYQNIEGMDKIREQTRLRVAKHRAKQKQIECNATVTLRNATDIDIDKEKEIDKEIDIYNPPYTPPFREGEEKEAKPKKRFTPPTIEEVAEYCNSRNNGIDPEEFWHFYNSKNWMIGKDKMTSWKSAVITWEKSAKKKAQPKRNGSSISQFATADEYWDSL